MAQPVRVLIVDDSAFMRLILAKHLESDPAITVVGKAHDGLDALAQIPALTPDVVTLNVEMPRMDGLTALKRIMAECPTPVIMLSAFTQRGARTTIYHNLLADRFESGFDLIVCRNVLIYFTAEVKSRLYKQFYDALRPGGVSFVGSAEVVFQAADLGFEIAGVSFYRRKE